MFNSSYIPTLYTIFDLPSDDYVLQSMIGCSTIAFDDSFCSHYSVQYMIHSQIVISGHVYGSIYLTWDCYHQIETKNHDNNYLYVCLL